ncbi:hypothetical protein P8452_70807 [Trifolium repens]|nr:hypothetical protein P8452_70807 [Trifolium repens]
MASSYACSNSKSNNQERRKRQTKTQIRFQIKQSCSWFPQRLSLYSACWICFLQLLYWVKLNIFCGVVEIRLCRILDKYSATLNSSSLARHGDKLDI